MADALELIDEIARRLGLSHGVVERSATCGVWIADTHDDTRHRAEVFAAALRQKGVTARRPRDDGAGVFVPIHDDAVTERATTSVAFSNSEHDAGRAETDD